MPATNMSSPFLERSTEAAMPEYTWSSVSNLPSTAAAWRGESADGGACAVEPERWWVRALPTEPLAASGLEPLPPMRRPLASLWGAGTRQMRRKRPRAALWLPQRSLCTLYLLYGGSPVDAHDDLVVSKKLVRRNLQVLRCGALANTTTARHALVTCSARSEKSVQAIRPPRQRAVGQEGAGRTWCRSGSRGTGRTSPCSRPSC